MITDRLELEPLGGLYRRQFWPVSQASVAEMEAHVGTPLATSYVEFVTTYGSSRPSTEMVLEAADGSLVAFDSFYGDPPENDASSVVRLAQQYPDLRRLTIGSAENGLFFLSADGSVSFERSGTNDLVRVAESFEQFVEMLRPDPLLD